MNAAEYVKAKTSNTVLADRASRIFNNLAVAGITQTTKVTSANKSSIDALLAKLERKLGSKASPSTVTAKKPLSASKETQEQALTYTASLRKAIDPATGEALNRIKLLGGIEAFHNPNTRVVYPIPASGSVPAFV